MSDTLSEVESKITNDRGNTRHTPHTKSVKLFDLQQSPFILNLFTKYCAKDHSKENLDFLEQARELLNVLSLEIEANPKQQEKILISAQGDFKKLFVAFISDKATVAITLSAKLHKILAEQNELYDQNRGMVAFKPESFTAAIKEVEMLVDADPMQRFVQSTSYKQSQSILKLVRSLKEYLEDNSQNAPKEGCCCFKNRLTLLQQVYMNLDTLKDVLDKLLSYKDGDFAIMIEKITIALATHTKLVSNEQDEMTIFLKKVKMQLATTSSPTLTSKSSKGLEI